MYKYWEKLLLEWRKKGKDGLSIPYIIGSQQYLNESPNQDIEILLKDIIYNSKNEIYITYCMNIDDLILGIRDDSKKNIKGYFPIFNGHIQNKFYVTNFISDLGNNIETITENLNHKYLERIEKKEFSINDRITGDYNMAEIEFITRCFK